MENIYAYDAQGHALVGVQLVDQTGARLAVRKTQFDDMGSFDTILTPWMNGRTKLYNVFPLPEQSADPDTGSAVGEPRLPAPPFASLPPVTLAGVQPSVLVPPQTAAQRAAAAKKATQEKAQKKAEARRKALNAEKRSGNGG